MKLWKRAGKAENSPATAEAAVLNQNELANSSSTDGTPNVSQEEIQETFKEHYPLLLPFSYAAIVEDEKSELKYSILEPTLTELDNKWVNEIKSILWDELSVNTKGFKNKEDADEFLKLKILETSLKYKINVDANTLGKYQYFIARDFLGFGKIDGIMRDENIEDVSCDGMNSPVFVWHRKYESIPSNIKFETQQKN